MRRRVLIATISSVVVAVLLLGLPLAAIGARLIHDNELRSMQTRAAQVGRLVDGRVQRGEPMTQDVLGSLVTTASGSLTMRAVVVTSAGDQYEAGPEISGRTVETAARTDANTIVVVSVSYWALAWRSGQVILLVVAASVLAVGAGAAVGVWQANRLSEPLVLLAASAEQLGSGQVRPSVASSGVEEIDMVAAELSRSAERMAQRLAVERQFAADTSHQLRTPLTAMSMRLEEIAQVSTDPYVQSEASACLDQVDRLSGVIDDLLARSRHASGGTTEPVTVADLVAQQRTEWEPSFERAGRALVTEIPGDIRVLATPGALAQVIATLIENSLKHGDGTTTVRCGRSPDRTMVVLTVGDEGTGVDDSIAGRIFEREVTSGNGTGLGLALARDLVASDGGRLELSQRVPAVFSVFLLAVPATADPSAVLPVGRTASQRH